MVDTELYNLKSLTYLNLDGNKFKNISMGKLINKPKTVKAVSMSNNLLTYIRLEYFDPLINLEYYLNLAFNKISYIGGAFMFLKKLNTLILSYNNLAKLDTYDIPFMCESSLEYIAIDHNLVMFIDTSEVLNDLPFLKKIAIMGNPWYCNCLRDFRKGLQERKIQEINDSDYVNTKRTVCFADLTTNNKCSISTSKFVSIVLEDDRGLPLNTNTTSCHLNEFE
ncbi:leucine-rich repeat and death domain-containing protein 1-like [Diabrotica virgifera virgifera]|uniref:Uncharacterized protein n=1 Tax=Diabrotica virgifera virgifera TaxID=50390 RepID=A0ABM5KFR6_DIAVI|nr:leucine-rich repeat and death domain-containing protein 1-like [Diabrotica virgifera virgifera]